MTPVKEPKKCIIASILVLSKKDRNAIKYIRREDISGGKSARMEGGRFKVYSEECCSMHIPREWLEKGITISGERCYGFVNYKYLTGDQTKSNTS